MRWSAFVGVVVAVAVGLGGPPSTAAAEAQDGLRHLGTTTFGPRLQELRFATPAVEGETRVRILLPAGYDADETTRYPVLWLLHGGAGSYLDWVDVGDADAITAGHPVIVVMPDSGPFGWYVDWWNFGAGGPPQWETYHLRQLLPWIDDHYRTVPDRTGRAIAGLSMGGGGAMHYAAVEPDLFVAAAAFSGAVDTNTLPVQLLVTATGLEDLRPPGSQVGLRATDEIRWRGHNPWDLAENLDGLSLHLMTGNGRSGGPGGGGDPIEQACHEMMTNLHRRLEVLGTPHVWNDYGPGGHTWWYWQRDLRELLPPLMEVFADPPPPPAEVRHRSIDAAYEAYGWEVALDRPVVEFSELREASATGFTLQGSGSAVVTTPAAYAPGEALVGTVRDATGSHERVLTAADDGRLTVPVSLGPANPFQQLSPAGVLWAAGVAPGGGWPAVTATVELRPTGAAVSATGAESSSTTVTTTAQPAAARLPATGGGAPALAVAAAIVAAAATGALRATAARRAA